MPSYANLIFWVVNIQRVRSGKGKDAVGRVPGGMKYFAAKVENVDGNLVLFPFVAVANTARF